MYSAKIQVRTGSTQSHPPTPVSSQKSSRNRALFSGLYKREVHNNIAAGIKARLEVFHICKTSGRAVFFVFSAYLGKNIPDEEYAGSGANDLSSAF